MTAAMTTVSLPPSSRSGGMSFHEASEAASAAEVSRLSDEIRKLEARVQAGEQRRRAMLHIMSDLAETNRKLNFQRKAMLHIMGDLRQTTEAIGRREQELREKQDQLVQAGKLATLGELTTGIAHELNNPLNNIGLYVGNVLDQIAAGRRDQTRIIHNLTQVMDQVSKATEIISHLRTFGHAAPVSRELISINEVIERSLALLREQLRLREVEIRLSLADANPQVSANAIQLEQVLMNLISNARDAVMHSQEKVISISSRIDDKFVRLEVADSGPGIPPDLEGRIFDPFFTTKEVGEGTGLGLSIVYGIIKDHEGSISVEQGINGGARFVILLRQAAN